MDIHRDQSQPLPLVTEMGHLGGFMKIKADAVRELIEKIHFKPMEAERQVAVIPDADRMNENAENALLKTLEEPPGDAALILTTSRPEALLPTTRSRCARVPFGAIDTETLEALLVEQFDVSPKDAPEVAPRLARAAREGERIIEEHGKALESSGDFTKAAARRVEALRLISVAGLLLRDAMLNHWAGGQGARGPSAGRRRALDWYERALSHLAHAERAVRQNVRVGLVLQVLFIRLAMDV